MRTDPLRDPKPLIDRIYAYVAYRVPSRADSEDITGDVFERALRYRSSYDSARGEPIQWLIGIAQRCIDDWRRDQSHVFDGDADPSLDDATEQSIDRLAIAEAIGGLEARERELIALKYGADLSTRQMAKVLEMQANAVDVALHRARRRLRTLLDEQQDDVSRASG